MRTILNIIWVVFAGFWLWLTYLAAGVLACLLIVTIPWGIASFRMANYALWPFGRTIVDKPDAGPASTIGNIVWDELATSNDLYSTSEVTDTVTVSATGNDSTAGYGVAYVLYVLNNGNGRTS